MQTMHYTESESQEVARKLLALIAPDETRATVVGLSGELGAGKTTLTQSIATLLGVQETVQSPTFVIAKFYPTTQGAFSHLIHIDAYRIEQEDELVPLGFAELLEQPNTLVVIEWPEKIEAALPGHTYRFAISHNDGARSISLLPAHA